ncbi:hypothetical protein HanHA300_Chr03g0087421 [Helianthus annuus]|nr:hypothetical protein HanHA300_Chr03g0087421 [Helianthus annuus]KAJ0607632.1 hypothetical protein HanHA89_Chr03g0099001 [Helianthus annuus]KAJ0767697.1 hypothetical protein HanLR1_Chr03g0092371 [Helianthus annuus]
MTRLAKRVRGFDPKLNQPAYTNQNPRISYQKLVPLAILAASPKSASLIEPEAERRILSGFTSR